MMTILIILSALFIIVSKFLDCYTTQFVMAHIDMERNWVARRWMHRWGKEMVIWGIFLISILITSITAWMVLDIYIQWYWQWTFVVLAFFISMLQSAVAHTNYFGRYNLLTRFISRVNWYNH